MKGNMNQVIIRDALEGSLKTIWGIAHSVLESALKEYVKGDAVIAV